MWASPPTKSKGVPADNNGNGRTGASAPTDGHKGCGAETAGGVEPRPYGRATRVRCVNVSPSVMAFGHATSLTEGGLMPRRCRGIRGDVGIAPYGRFIEGTVVGWRAGS